MSKQNLDNFFKNTFENFEEFPPEIVWGNIEAQLSKKKKRRVVPFWWKFSGVAALLLISFGIYNFYFNDSVTQKTNAIEVVTKEKEKTTISKTPALVKTIHKSNIKNTNNTQIVNHADKTENNKTNSANNSFNENHNNLYAASNGYSKNKVLTTKRKKNVTPKPVLVEQKNNNNTIVQNNITVTKTDIATNTSTHKTDSVAEIKILKDSIQVAKETQELEKLLNNEKESKLAEQKVNRWQLTPQVAPIYFGSNGQGSPLDEKLETNSKQYNTSYSYGLGINYALSKKIDIKTGVNYLTTNYDTNDVLFYQKSNAAKIHNINPTPAGELIEIQSLTNVDPYRGKLLDKNEGIINQEMSYIEMPVEVSYKIINKKFGLNLIGGISALFLNDNNVYLKTSGFNMKIGEATNLNDVHISTNIGLGLKYNIYKKFTASVEPTFKYQINTFSNNAGNFNPYVFGVYSGISFSF